MKKSSNKTLNIIIPAGFIILLIGVFLIWIRMSSAIESPESTEDNPSLLLAAEDLNHILPQRQGFNTNFDSVGVTGNNLQYYYSVQNLTVTEFSERSLRDSLFDAAVKRIPCSLWRPVYMQGVDVSFTYLTIEGDELLSFTRSQNTCN